MDAHIEERLVHATGLIWSTYKGRHPNLAAAIEAELGTPIDRVIETLDKGPEYQELLAQTEAETNIANLVKILAPIVMDVIFGFVK